MRVFDLSVSQLQTRGTTHGPCTLPVHCRARHCASFFTPLLPFRGQLMDGWSPSPKPTRFSKDNDASSTDECMRTPEGEIRGSAPSPIRSTARVPRVGIEALPSPTLQKKGGINNMKHTPQPTLTQSKLTSILQIQPKPDSEGGGPWSTSQLGGRSHSRRLKWIHRVPRQPHLPRRLRARPM